MKKVVFITICLLSTIIFSSCGSSKRCGLASKTKQVNYQQDIIVAEVTVK